MTQHKNKSNLWKLTLALLVASLVVSLCVGAFSLTDFSSRAEETNYVITSADVKELGENYTVFSDLSPEQIKDLLVVTGYDDNAEDKTPTNLDSSLYYVTIDGNGGKLVAGTGNSVSVAVKGSADKTAVNGFTEINVQLATATASITAIEEFAPSGNYFINSDGYYAFVQGMTAEQVQSRLAVKFTYPNHTEYKVFGDGVQWATSAPIAFGDALNTNDATIDITLQVDEMDEPVTGSVTFAPLKEVGLKLVGWTQSMKLTPATEVSSFINTLQGCVYYVLNSGYDGNPVTVESDLIYSGLCVGATVGALSLSPNEEFDKVLSIPAKNKDVADLKIPLRVKYTGFRSIGTSLSQDGFGAQTARSEKINVGDVYATVSFENEYGDGIDTKLYLKDIIKAYEDEGNAAPVVAQFFEGSKEVSQLTRQVSRIKLTYTAPNGTVASRTYTGLQISPMTVSAPTIKDTELTYSNQGCSTEIDGLMKDDPAYGDDMIISSVSEGAEVLEDGKTIKFNRGGEFTISVTFKNGSLSDFVFQQGSGNGTVNATDPTVVTYTVNVLKAPITVSLNNFESEYQYGSDEPNYTVRGEASETMYFSAPKSNNLKAPALPLPQGYVLPAENDKTSGDNGTPSFLLYYTGTLAVAKDGSTDYISYDFPTARGSYKAHVITAETGWFDAGTTDTPFEFDIVERKISLGDIKIPSVKYDRDKSYTLEDILSTVTVDNLVNPDEKKDVLTWEFAAAGEVKHANDYTISFTIKNPNYKWNDTEDTTKEATFEIEALVLDMNIVLNSNNFAYGDVKLDHSLNLTCDGSSVDSFYAVVSSAAYFKVVDGVETSMTGTDFSAWDAGNYKVKYTTSIDTTKGDLTGDYNLPTAEADFTISRRTISQIKLDKTSETFIGSGIDFAIVNSNDSALDNGVLANGQTYADILSVNLVSAVLKVDGKTDVAEARRSYTDCIFTAIDAATYTYKVELNANYTWDGVKNSDGCEEITLEFEINRATVEIKWASNADETAVDWSSNAIAYTYDGNAHYPVLSAQSGLMLNYHFLYADGETTVTVDKGNADNSIIDARTYWVRVTDFTGENLTNADYTLAVNYVLPSSPYPLDKSFTIASSGLDKPTLITGGEVSGNLVTVTYNGSAVDFTSYIQDYIDKYMLGSTLKLTITFDGSATSPKNVKGSEEAYSVSVKPAGNFEWKEGQYTESNDEAVTFELKITKLPIVISWNEDAFGDYVYNGKAQTVKLDTNYTFNKQGDDDIGVTFTYTGDMLTDGEAINAGTYTVTVAGVKGTAANNYTITGATNSSHLLTIDPFKLTAPVFADNAELMFNGSNQSKALRLADYTSDVAGFDWSDVLNVAISGVWKFDDINKEHGTYDLDSCFVISDNTAAFFTFTNAGDYTLTFSVENDNYVWADNDAEKTLSFTVNRATIKAPDLLENRAMEWDKDITEFGNAVLNGANVSGVRYTVVYGTRLTEPSKTSDIQADVDRNSEGKGIQGQYFAQLTIEGNNAWNYVWEVLPDGKDDNGNKVFVRGTYIEGASAGPYSVSYDKDHGAQVQLFYAITAGQVEISYQVKDYMFGANGVADGTIITADEHVELADVVFTTTTGIPAIKETLIKFYVNGTTGENRVALSGNQLVNNLPWKAGVYDVEIVITFEENEKYTNWNSSGLVLTVSERPINVAWSFGGSSELTTTYNGNEQTVTASITNIPKSGVADIDNIVDIALTLIYKLNGTAATPKNAGTYSVEVDEITGNDASNFTKTDGVGIKSEFIINKIQVTVNATAVTDHIYGNVITNERYPKLYTITNGSFLGEDEKNIQIQIRNVDKEYDRADPIGSYTVTPTWNGTLPTLKDGVYTIDADNYFITVSTADFKVIARTITVSFNSVNATSVYGAQRNVDLSNVYLVECSEDGAWLVGNDSRGSVFTLSSDATKDYADANTYDVTLNVVGNKNYIVKVGETTVTSPVKLGEYTITNADITDIEVEGYNDEYDGQGHDLFVLGANSVNDQTLTWYYQIAGDTLDEDGTWTAYTHQQIKNVNDSKQYYIKVTAPNHNVAYFVSNGSGIKVNVAVTKKQVTVQVDLSIQFGEASPDSVKYLMKLVDVTTSGKYTFEDLCENINDVSGLKVVEEKQLYTVTGYEQGVTGVNDTKATIAFNPDSLTADNYTFVNADGELTVTPLVLNVTIKDASNVYYSTYVEVKFETEITLPSSTYNATQKIALTDETIAYINASHDTQGYKGANIFTLSTTAFADTNADTRSNDAGSDYIITGELKNDSDNYGAEFSTATHTITRATLTINEYILGYDALYDEDSHVLVYTKDNSKFATASNGITVYIQYCALNLAFDQQFNDDASAEKWQGFTISGIVTEVAPSSIDVCHKAVYYRLYTKDNNYEDYYSVREAKISKTSNSFTNESDLVINDWTYGLYNETTNPKGYNATITDPQTAFDRFNGQDSANKLIVTLSRGGEAIEGLVGDYNTISQLFEYMWNNGLFSTGDYVLTLTMIETDNYGKLEKTIEFAVTPKELVITAQDQTVVYGNEFETGYTYKVEGLVVSKTGGELETREIAFAGMTSTDFFTTSYAVGRVGGSVGDYGIETTANAIAANGNYTLTYVTAGKKLTVTPRPITITIGDYVNSYNERAERLPSELQYSLLNGTAFADGDVDVIVLRTLAIANYGVESFGQNVTTNNVIVLERGAYSALDTIGAYPIYAVFGADAKGEGKDTENYVVAFENCNYDRELENFANADGKDVIVIAENDKPIVGGAGKYQILRTSIMINYVGVTHKDDDGNEIQSFVYSGAVNYFKATTNDENVTMTFTYGYKKNAADNYTDIKAEDVVNAGYYMAYGRLSSDNYHDTNSNQSFQITKATVTLTANTAEVQYGTTLDGSNPTDKADGRFSGFGYTYDKGSLLQSVYDEYIEVNPVTYATTYTVKTPAGTDNVTITPVCKSDGNVTVSTVSAKLTVLKRDVVVTVYGFDDVENNQLAQCDYLGTAEATQAKLESIYTKNWANFLSVDSQGASGDGLDALNVSFSLVGEYNVQNGGYGMSVTSGNSNYNVSFKTANGGASRNEITSTDEDAPKFVINKAKLVIYANAIVNNGVADGYSIIYGNDVSSISWTYHVEGIKGTDNFAALLSAGGQTITYSRTNDNKQFEPWKSNVGEEYEVAVNKLYDLDNYDLVNSQYKPAKLTIEKRTITVTTENQTFTWNGSNNGGAFGNAHEAVLTFSDTLTANNDSINKNINEKYRPNTVVKYNTVASSSYNQTAGSAPTRVGDYKVTVTLNDDNYKFAGGGATEIDFSVTRRVLDELNLRWNTSSILWTDGGEEFSAANSVENYIDYVMEIVLFTFTPYGSNGSKIIEKGNAETPNTYYFDGLKLAINATERGRYEVRFKLRDSALWNYKLESSNETLVVSSFVISSSTIDMTLRIDDWTYNTTPNAPVVTVNGATVSGVEFRYARVTDETNVADYYGNGENGKGQLSGTGTLAIDEYTGINSITFNAGYYVVSATYWGTVEGSDEPTSVMAFFVFKVNKATVAMPNAHVEGYVFNGQEQTLAIEYPTDLIRASYDGRTSINSDGIDVFATDAKTYTVTFTLVNDSNYEWANGGVDAYELSWIISKDERSNADSDILTIGKKDFESSYGSVSVTGEKVADGYVSNVDRYFVVASEGMDFDTIDQWANEVEWTNGLPANVGSYYVKLVLNGNSNFSDKETYVKLEVIPYVIEVSASGTITYGNGDWQAAVRYEDVISPYGHRVIGTATYSLAEDYGTLQAGGEYYVIADHDENGVAIGLTMSDNAGANYVIKATQGRLTVNKRDITVTLGNATSQYGRAIDLSGVSVDCGQGQLVGEDSLKLTLYVVDAENAINVGGYIINATYDNDNYNVTINPGTYTITARRITIEVVQGGGTYGGKINPVNLSKVLDDKNVDVKDFVEQNNLDLDIYYVGLANDNTSYNSTVMPTKAGTYIATVRGSDNDNFVIIGEVSTSFVINKKSVDGSLITIANQTYTSSALTPVINSDEFVAEYGSNLFEEVVRDVEFVNAGSYTVTLRIKDFANYKWQSVEIAERDYTFVIDKADNELTSDIVIAGWTYGRYSVDNNLPGATVKFGQSEVTFLYSNAIDGIYTSGAPAAGDVGEYWVKVSVPADDNYNAYTSDPVKFAITKRALAKPTLTIITEGEGKNDVYTGEHLVTAIVGYDMALMNLVYDDINVNGGQIIARATNAGVYEIKLSIANTHNYCWQGTSDNEITLTWIIAPKAIARPTANTDVFIVNGNILTYIPEGFDEETMTISGNETAYGGEFPVTIGLKDKANYVWAEGGTEDFTLTWNVVGINTVFIIVASVLGGASAIALIALGVQIIRDNRRRRLIDLAIDARSQVEAMKAPKKSEANEENGGGND